MHLQLPGLTPATHTPFNRSGELELSTIERQAEYLSNQGIHSVFVVGSTGESHCLTIEERLAVADRWLEVTQKSKMKVVVHVGTNSLKDAKVLSARAANKGSAAIAALAPSHFKPSSLDDLISWTAEIAAAAPQTPFYFYDIPALTGCSFSMAKYLEVASRSIGNLVGLKFTNADMISFQRCLHGYPQFDILWGIDECLLAALSFGAKGAVGSTYNFAAPLYLKLIKAFQAGDQATAAKLQYESVRLVDLLSRFGYMAAAKATMEYLGVHVGAPRKPFTQLSDSQRKELYEQLDSFQLK